LQLDTAFSTFCGWQALSSKLEGGGTATAGWGLSYASKLAFSSSHRIRLFKEVLMVFLEGKDRPIKYLFM
jgi:hypothetical protein